MSIGGVGHIGSRIDHGRAFTSLHLDISSQHCLVHSSLILDLPGRRRGGEVLGSIIKDRLSILPDFNHGLRNEHT